MYEYRKTGNWTDIVSINRQQDERTRSDIAALAQADTEALKVYKGVFERAALVLAWYRGSEDDPDARVLRALASSIQPSEVSK